MVVTCISAWPSSARKPPDRPTAASLAQLYGNRCGTRTMPPMEVIFPIRPLRRARICGRTARGGYSTPQTSRPGLPRNLPWLWAWAQPGLFPHYSLRYRPDRTAVPLAFFSYPASHPLDPRTLWRVVHASQAHESSTIHARAQRVQTRYARLGTCERQCLRGFRPLTVALSL